MTLLGLAAATAGCQRPDSDTGPATALRAAEPDSFPHLTAFVRDTVHPRALDDVVLNELARALQADPQVRVATLAPTDPDRVALLQGALDRLDARFDRLLVLKLRARGFPTIMTESAAVWQLYMALSLPGWHSNDYQALVDSGKGALEYRVTLAVRTVPVVDTLTEAHFQGLTTYVNLAYVLSDLTGPTGYPPLGIPTTDAACLYVNPVHAFFTAPPCRDTLTVAPPGVTMLKVNRVSYASVPPVSRWEWSTRQHVNTVGLKCGDAWCEVVPERFGAGDPEKEDPQDAEPARPEFATKPWYDFQKLGDGTPIRPDGPRGRIRPAPGIAQLNDSINPVQDRFVEVAVVWLYGPPGPKYQRLGLRAGRNVVSICHGSEAACSQDAGNPPGFPSCGTTDAYFSRISNRRDSTYGCPIYTFEGMGRLFITTARWAWDPADEGMWIRCPEGCCQIKGS